MSTVAVVVEIPNLDGVKSLNFVLDGWSILYTHVYPFLIQAFRIDWNQFNDGWRKGILITIILTKMGGYDAQHFTRSSKKKCLFKLD